MKILILQLARLGDLYMSWPAMKALRRQYPTAEIHLMVRSSFKEAMVGNNSVNKIIELNSEKILFSFFHQYTDENNLQQATQNSQKELHYLTAQLKAEKYDWIINATFSPFSSFLTHELASANTKVSGYSRHNDGYFQLPDELSAYFYAQVGIDKPNRIHLIDLFSSLFEVQYSDDDFKANIHHQVDFALPQKYIVLHIGASQSQKVFNPVRWTRYVRYLWTRTHMPICLIGGPGERITADLICGGNSQAQIVDLVGKTKLVDLFPIIQNAELLVGCDSVALHIGTLTNTPTLNISLGKVNFWETGPKAQLSFIYRIDEGETVYAERVAEVTAGLVEGQMAPELIYRHDGYVSYFDPREKQEPFSWKLIKSIYLGDRPPVTDDMNFVQAVQKLGELNDFILEQLNLFARTRDQRFLDLIARAEESINAFNRLAPSLSPMINWLTARKTQIKPATQEQLIEDTIKAHKEFQLIMKPYLLKDDMEVVYG